MIVVMILTQGELGQELVSAARNIVGDIPHITAVSLPWSATFEEDLSRVRHALGDLDAATDILFVTDMFGATPHNVAMEFANPGKVEVVSGANLPMVVRLGCPGATDRSVQELAQWITQKARKSICSTPNMNREGSDDEGRGVTREDRGEQDDRCNG